MIPIAKKPQAEIIEFVPFPGQDRIFLSKARFIFASAGQRGGKTKAGCYWANINMNIPGTNGMICANTIDQLNQSVLDKFFSEFPQLKRYWVKRDKMLSLPNGSKVYFRSLDNPEMIRGLNLHWIWPDEIDGQNYNTWKILEGRVANTKGRILGTSSIYRKSFVHEMYKRFKDDPDYEFITWESVANPSFPPEEYERLKRTWDPIDFAREFGGQFSFATGQVYPLDERFIIDKLQKTWIDKSGEERELKVIDYIYGLDYGINDPNVITVNAFCSDGNWYIIDEYYEPNLSIQQINHWLDYFITKYKRRPYATCQDPAGGVARNSLINECRPQDAVKDIIGRVKLIRNLIYQGKIFVLKNCVNTRREFEYHMFDLKNPEMPEDKNNHCLDSFGYAIHTTWDQIQGKAKVQAKEEELIPFWQNKKELYKQLESGDNDNIGFKREVDSWSQY
jgi:PBSX family phage terminase large subunit